MAPSPTADATRLVEPFRTSPAANRPGRVVSSADRGEAGYRARILAAGIAAAGPVSTNPRSSRAASPRSQPVLG